LRESVAALSIFPAAETGNDRRGSFPFQVGVTRYAVQRIPYAACAMPGPRQAKSVPACAGPFLNDPGIRRKSVGGEPFRPDNDGRGDSSRGSAIERLRVLFRQYFRNGIMALFRVR